MAQPCVALSLIRVTDMDESRAFIQRHLAGETKPLEDEPAADVRLTVGVAHRAEACMCSQLIEVSDLAENRPQRPQELVALAVVTHPSTPQARMSGRSELARGCQPPVVSATCRTEIG